ncbi:MAG: hypothetical protein Aurels2KO_13700 [Aureliella sp.]
MVAIAVPSVPGYIVSIVTTPVEREKAINRQPYTPFGRLLRESLTGNIAQVSINPNTFLSQVNKVLYNEETLYLECGNGLPHSNLKFCSLVGGGSIL